jgi:hypothetical protein
VKTQKREEAGILNSRAKAVTVLAGRNPASELKHQFLYWLLANCCAILRSKPANAFLKNG